MEADELMKNDWVNFLRKPTRVRLSDLGDELICKHFEAIPITMDILENSGFHYQLVKENAVYPKREWMHWRESKRKGVTCELREDGWKLSIEDLTLGDNNSTYFIKHIRYVHELQHAFWLCNINKEITL